MSLGSGGLVALVLVVLVGFGAYAAVNPSVVSDLASRLSVVGVPTYRLSAKIPSGTIYYYLYVGFGLDRGVWPPPHIWSTSFVLYLDGKKLVGDGTNSDSYSTAGKVVLSSGMHEFKLVAYVSTAGVHIKQAGLGLDTQPHAGPNGLYGLGLYRWRIQYHPQDPDGVRKVVLVMYVHASGSPTPTETVITTPATQTTTQPTTQSVTTTGPALSETNTQPASTTTATQSVTEVTPTPTSTAANSGSSSTSGSALSGISEVLHSLISRLVEFFRSIFG